jgi:hypothetical protein
MDARVIISQVVSAMKASGLEAVLIGCGAASMQGAPVSTDDLDFMFRATPQNLLKLKDLAIRLRASLSQPHYPMSRLWRLVLPDGTQIDMMDRIDGIRSFESLRSRSSSVPGFGDGRLHIADLGDVIKSKKAANRPKDRAVMPMLEATLREKRQAEKKK